jgi:hypothetical protein
VKGKDAGDLKSDKITISQRWENDVFECVHKAINLGDYLIWLTFLLILAKLEYVQILQTKKIPKKKSY